MTDPNAPQEGAQPYQPPQYQPPQPPGASYGPPAGGPYGAPPAGDPYAPPAAGPYGAPPTGTPYQPVPQKKGRAGKIIGIVAIVAVIVLAVCVGGGYYLYKNSDTATKANEGDCLSGNAITGTEQTTAALKVVKCDASDAKYKVIAKIPDKTQAEAVDALCQPYADKGAEVIYWQEKSVGAGVGNVLCLGPAKS